MIEIEYIVRDTNGVERLRTADKKAADAYDKALNNAERLQTLLQHDKILPNLPDQEMEELTIYLALNAKNIELVLKGKEPVLSNPQAEEAVADNVAPLKAQSK